jgi:hypothetical protein
MSCRDLTTPNIQQIIILRADQKPNLLILDFNLQPNGFFVHQEDHLNIKWANIFDYHEGKLCRILNKIVECLNSHTFSKKFSLNFKTECNLFVIIKSERILDPNFSTWSISVAKTNRTPNEEFLQRRC